MPKYELMYIIGSHIADNEIPKIAEEIKKSVESQHGTVEKLELLGKKKLAYPIKHSKVGDYVLVNFSAEAKDIFEIEHKIRTNPAIIRYILLNMEEALVRMEKDRVAQAKLKALRPREEREPEAPRRPAMPAEGPARAKKIQIDLDAEIEKALESEDLK